MGYKYDYFKHLFKYFPVNFNIHFLYLLKIRRLPNFQVPKSFNEKVNWRKLHSKKDIFVLMADKLRSKKYVQEICEDIAVMENIWIGNDIESLDYSELPEDYVIKGNFGSKMNIFVNDGDHIEKEKLKGIFESWNKNDQYKVFGEWAYKDIERKIYIEEYLSVNGSPPTDYKFFVFDGKVQFIQVDSDRFGTHKRNIMNRDWEDTGIVLSHPGKEYVPKPDLYSEMVQMAEKLSQSLDFVRVDLYEYNGQIYFGEYTIYPGAGYEKFDHYEDDLHIGKFWSIDSR